MDKDVIERLAIEQAVYNAIGADLKTGVDGNLRGEANDFYRDLYEMTGAKNFDVRVNGQKVGTYYFTAVKATEGHTEHEFICYSHDAAMQATVSDADFASFVVDWQLRHIDQIAEDYFRATGCVVDGCTVNEVEVEGTPETIKPNGTLRIDKVKVANAMGDALPPMIAGLLAGDVL